MKEVNLAIGRFQPFTEGHFNMIRQDDRPCVVYHIIPPDRTDPKVRGRKISREEISEIIYHISGSEIELSSVSKEILKRPFSNDVILKELSLIRRLNPGVIEDVVCVKNAYEAVDDFVKKTDSGLYTGRFLICGSDRTEEYKSLLGRVPGALDKLSVKTVVRDGISGTAVRETIYRNDLSGFRSMMPLGTEEMFSVFQKDIKEFENSLIKLI